MSRAFVKENDLEHAGIDIPERPISHYPNYVTPNGLLELNKLIIFYESEKEKLKKLDDPTSIQQKSRMDRDLRYYLSRLKSAILIEPKNQNKKKVLFSATVELINQDNKKTTFQIVGEDEANIKKNKISYISPLAKKLIGNKIKDEILWEKPSGDESLIINNIQYK